MVSHDATGQLTGYLYQVLSALLLLFESRDNEAQICLEKFDDIAFIENDEPIIMIQTKHHLKQAGNLTDTSTDLWRTINSWSDSLKESPSGLRKTSFIIITTSSIPRESATAYLSEEGNIRDTERALNLLLTAANSKTKTNEKYYSNFLALPSKLQKYLVGNIYIYSNVSKIQDLKTNIMRFVRCATIQQYEESVYTRLIGWWIGEIIKCLISEELTFINRMQLQRIMYDISSEYKEDSLPIDVDYTYNPTEHELTELNQEKRIFIEQLKLIALSDKRIKRCICDYYNAFRQRSRWVREQLVFINELSDYETRLIDEWNRLYLIMDDELTEYGEAIPEKLKVEKGKLLFGSIENLGINIREKVNRPFIMRGTYHELANKLRVGWHIDFMTRLCHLLQG
jgi:hypothetical protein